MAKKEMDIHSERWVSTTEASKNDASKQMDIHSERWVSTTSNSDHS